MRRLSGVTCVVVLAFILACMVLARCGGGSEGGGATPTAASVHFMAATDGSSGVELWRSDGTEAGTVRVKDINAGAGGSFPSFRSDFALFDGAVYFRADDGTSGFELWKSDGTEAGTVPVRDINPGANDGWLSQCTLFNGALYFMANDGTSGYELWRSDGTGAGTARVKDINPGPGSGYWVN